MAQLSMTPERLPPVAARLNALAEPARREILNALRSAERSVFQLSDVPCRRIEAETSGPAQTAGGLRAALTP